MTLFSQSKWKRWVAVFGALSIIAAIAATQLTIRTGVITLETWLQLFLIQLIIWNVWGVLTPFIFKLSNKISWEKGRVRFVLIHIPVSLITILLFLALYTSIFHFFSGTSFGGFIGTFITLIISSFHWFLILYWITVGFDYYLRVADSYKTQEMLNLQLEGQLSEAQLKALKMQLNPHFLFNSLNTISGLIRSGETKKSVNMLAKLSDFLREVLIDKGKQEITVANEISFLEKYLEIEKLRFGEKLNVSISVDENAEYCMIPSLILQPLVENSIKHGISKKKDASDVSIQIMKTSEHLELKIYNDGPGIASKEKALQKGVGLSNTMKRLEQSYGSSYSFNIENKEGGVEIQIHIPISY